MDLFQVKAVVLDPANEFNVDRTLTKEDVQKLIKVHWPVFSSSFAIKESFLLLLPCILFVLKQIHFSVNLKSYHMIPHTNSNSISHFNFVAVLI